jgi:hypothetical protein
LVRRDKHTIHEVGTRNCVFLKILIRIPLAP